MTDRKPKEDKLKMQQEAAPWAFNTDSFIQTKVGSDDDELKKDRDNSADFMDHKDSQESSQPTQKVQEEQR